MSNNLATLKNAFKEFIWPRKKVLLIGLVLIVLGRGASFIIPYESKVLIDEVVEFKNYVLLKEILVIVGIAFVVQATTSFLLVWLLGVEAQHLISKLRARVQKHVLGLPISYYDDNKSGALVSRIMTDVTGVRNLIGTGLVQMVGGILTAIVSIYFTAQINLFLTLILLIPISIFAIIALKAFGYIRPIFRKRGKINAEVTGRLTETLNGARVIKGFNAEEQENVVFEKGVDRLFRNIKKSMTATALIQSSSTFIIGLATTTIMGIGGWYMIEGDMTTGEFLAFNMYLAFMVAPILQMGNIGSQLTEALAGLDRTEELLNMPREVDDTERTETISDIEGHVIFQDVSFAYDKEKEVIHSISFTAPPGTVTALVGTSGSGKSTIAGLVSSFMNPTGGVIYIDGNDLSKQVLDSYRQYLGVVLQDDFLFEGTIRENILFPRPNSSEAELMSAVKAAYVDEFADGFDEGLETVIGERGVKLSGGQRQRVAIARAILANPRILILDEATSNLDNESEAFIQKSLEKLMDGRTVFVIAHRLSTIRKADQILVIEDGQIQERGTHDELIKSEGRYYELFTYQSRI